MNRIQLKCIHCDTAVASAAGYCPGCQAKLCRGAPLKLYVFALVGAIIIGGVCSSALSADDWWGGWLIGLAVLMGCWGLLDWLHGDRIRFRPSRGRRPDA